MNMAPLSAAPAETAGAVAWSNVRKTLDTTVQTAVQFEKIHVFTVQEVLRLREEGSLAILFVGGDWHVHGVGDLSSGDEEGTRWPHQRPIRP